MRAETPDMFEPHDPDDTTPSGEPDEPEADETTSSEPPARLDPDDLRSQRFILSLFGYDRGEVRAFLAHLADRLEGAASPGMPDAAPSFEAVGHDVTRILETTTQVAEELREKLVSEARRAHAEADEAARASTEQAEERARKIVEDAERRAERLLQEATEEAERIRATEHKARTELAGLSEMLSSVTQELETDEDG